MRLIALVLRSVSLSQKMAAKKKRPADDVKRIPWDNDVYPSQSPRFFIEAMHAGSLLDVPRLTIVIGRRRLWGILLAQANDSDLFFTHGVTLEAVGDPDLVRLDKDLKPMVATRCESHMKYRVKPHVLPYVFNDKTWKLITDFRTPELVLIYPGPVPKVSPKWQWQPPDEEEDPFKEDKKKKVTTIHKYAAKPAVTDTERMLLDDL